VVAVVQGGEGEGAAGERAGKRKRRHKLAQQPVRHSLWEQDSLEALNEVLAGRLEGEVRALKRRKAEYDEARRLSDGSDSCWSDSDGDSVNESTPELDIGPPALEGAVVMGAEVVEEGVATLQRRDRPAAEHRKRVQREEQAGGIKRRGGQGGTAQAGGKKRRQRQRRASQKQTGREWQLEGFSTSPGGTKPVAGCYTVGVVESQVWVQGPAGTEVWLGVKLAGTRGSRGSVIGWIFSGKLQGLVGGDRRWWDRLRGNGKEGWMVQGHKWEANSGEAAVAGGIGKGEVVGWYLPVRVVSEKALTRAGVRVVVQMKRVAVGRSAGAYAQAVGVRSRKEWCIQTMSRKMLVGTTGRLLHADGQEEVLVVGDEVWEEWTGSTVEGTDWRKGAKDEWAAKERAVSRRIQLRDVDRDQVYDKG
jgi:hypothetical protein